MINLNFSPRGFAAVAALATAGVGCSSEALAQQRLSADVSGGVAVATNPYLQSGPQTSAASAFVEVAPQYVDQDEVSQLRLRGRFRVQPFFQRYATDAVASLDLDYTEKRSDQLTVRGGANVQTSRSSAQDALLFGANGLTPVQPLPQFGDPTFLGTPARATNFSVRAGGTYLLGPREMIDLDLAASGSRFEAGALANFNYASQNIRYSRGISERTSLTFALQAGQSDFLDTSAGDGFTLTPLIGVQTQLSSTLTLSGSAGYSFARFSRTDGGKDNLGALALQASICSQRDLSSFCLNADRSVQPTAIGSVRTLNGVSAAYNRRFNEKDRLQLNVTYSLSEEGADRVAVPDLAFLGASAEWSRQLRPRLAIFGSATYADIFQGDIQGGTAPRANVQGQVGVRLRLGSIE